MRMQLAKEALKQALWSSDSIDFSYMTDDEVEELWDATAYLAREARIERSRRVQARIQGAMDQAKAQADEAESESMKQAKVVWGVDPAAKQAPIRRITISRVEGAQ